jgi:hypothetical protein
MGRVGRSSEVSSLVAFLCLDSAAFVSVPMFYMYYMYYILCTDILLYILCSMSYLGEQPGGLSLPG